MWSLVTLWLRGTLSLLSLKDLVPSTKAFTTLMCTRVDPISIDELHNVLLSQEIFLSVDIDPTNVPVHTVNNAIRGSPSRVRSGRNNNWSSRSNGPSHGTGNCRYYQHRQSSSNNNSNNRPHFPCQLCDRFCHTVKECPQCFNHALNRCTFYTLCYQSHSNHLDS